MGWTVFTAIDLYMGVFLIDLVSAGAPSEKPARLRKARSIVLILFGISIVVLGVRVA